MKSIQTLEVDFVDNICTNYKPTDLAPEEMIGKSRLRIITLLTNLEGFRLITSVERQIREIDKISLEDIKCPPPSKLSKAYTLIFQREIKE